MRLVTFTRHGRTTIGKLVGSRVIDLPAADPRLPATMKALLAGGKRLLAIAQEIDPEGAPSYPLSAVRLEAPVPDASKFLAIGMNYRRHVEEAKRAGINVPDSQVWFNKQVSCINGPYDPVQLPKVSDKLDYEVELGVVIGQRCRHVAARDAHSVIAGYVVMNDVSVRDWQMRSPTMTLGKSFDTTGPCGPWLVTRDEVPDPQALTLRLQVNGELRQEVSTADMIYSVADQVAYLSTVMTLEPGDLIATGTPSGVGAAMQPPSFLKVGDVVRAEIDGLGHIENRVVPEPA